MCLMFGYITLAFIFNSDTLVQGQTHMHAQTKRAVVCAGSFPKCTHNVCVLEVDTGSWEISLGLPHV